MAVCAEPAGTHYRTFKSQLVGGEVSYLVYLPPDYETNATRRYPVVYWLHGYGGSQRGGTVFVKPLDAAIRAGRAPAMIVVLVNGIAASFYCDSPNGQRPVDGVIITELIPHVDQTYRTIAAREARAVEGFSMGGYGAAHLGFKHPGIFGLVSIMSGALTDSVEWGPLKPPQGGRRKMMLNAEKRYFEGNDLATVIRSNADAIRGKTKVRIAVGSEDSLRPNNQAMHEFLGQLKIEHGYELVPGVGHDPRLVYGKLGERVFAWYLDAWSTAVRTFSYKTVKGCEIKADVYGQLSIEHEYELAPGVAHNGNVFYDALGDREFAHYRQALSSQRLWCSTSGPIADDAAAAGGQPKWRQRPQSKQDRNTVPAAAQRNWRQGSQPWRTGNASSPSGARPGANRPLPWWTTNASAPSYVLKRGDREILTFEKEGDYDRLQELYRQSQESQPTPGEMTTRYYRSDIDGSVQPYAVWLPRNYDPAEKYPLVIQLHGTNFKEVLSGSRLTYRGMPEAQWIEPTLPVIYAHCFGGPTTFYQGMGEVDVLKVIAEAKRLFTVDSDRVFIMGHSMGGAGSYTVGLHHPDQFGGILAGDPAMGPMAAAIPPDRPKWMEPQIAIVSPPKLYPNARNVDVFFKNAGAGIQRYSTEYSDGIVAEGGFATTEVLPGMPHGFGYLYHHAAWVTEVIQHPIRRQSAEVKFYTNTLQYNQAYWVTIDRLTQHNADASVTASCQEGLLRVTTTNIDALTLRLGDVPAPKGASARLVIDGRDVSSSPSSDVVHLSKQADQWNLGEWKSNGLVKRHGLQGPVGDAFNSRFLAVYGEGDRELAIAELDAVRNPIGPFDVHGDFPMKPAAKVTREDVESCNLLLFGSPQSNAVLKRIAPSLPAALLKAGSIFIYPNPENPSRYVVVWSTALLSAADPDLRAGWTPPLNLLPDYVEVKDTKIVAGGHFDSDWQITSPPQP